MKIVTYVDSHHQQESTDQRHCQYAANYIQYTLVVDRVKPEVCGLGTSFNGLGSTQG